MKILINCRPLLSGQGGAGGAGSYLHSLLEEMPRQGATVRVLATPANRGALARHAGCEVVVPADGEYEHLRPHLDWADAYLAPLNGVTPELLSCRIPILVTIHDLQHAVMPQFFDPAVIALRHRQYGLSVARADTVLTISEHERENIRRLYGKRSVHVTPLSGYLADVFAATEPEGPSDALRARFDWIGEEDFLLYPAIPWPHKNHVRLVQAFHALRRARPAHRTLRLLLTGAHDHPLARDNHRRLVEALGLDRAVVHAGFLEDRDLAWLFRRTRLLTFPSLYEGFGIPVCDAMKFGTPVIAARVAAVPEVGGDAIAYFRDPFDARAMAEDLIALLDDPDRLGAMVAAGRARGAGFSAAATARETLAACEAAAAARRDGGRAELVTIPEARSLQPRRTLSILVDATTVDGGALPGAVADLLERTRGHAGAVQMIGLFRDDAPAAARAAWRAAGGQIADVFADASADMPADPPVAGMEGDLAPALALAARVVRQELAEGDHLLFVQLDRFAPGLLRELGYACALLDADPARNVIAFGVRDAAGRDDALRLEPGLTETALIRAYRGQAAAPRDAFHNRLIRLRGPLGDALLTPAGVVALLKEPATLHLPVDGVAEIPA